MSVAVVHLLPLIGELPTNKLVAFKVPLTFTLYVACDTVPMPILPSLFIINLLTAVVSSVAYVLNK